MIPLRRDAVGFNWGFLQARKKGDRESTEHMQGEVLVSGWLLSAPVRFGSVRFTSVHGELRFGSRRFTVNFGSWVN